jgi:hypothetical protein
VRSAFSACHSRSEPIFPVGNLPAGDNPRRQITAFYIKQSLFMPPRSVLLLSRGRVPDSVRRRFSAPAHRHRKSGFCVVCLPAIRAFQRHSTQHLLHYGSPFGFHFCFRSVPSGLVQRTGCRCSACGLDYPHQVWWAPPMYIARAWSR